MIDELVKELKKSTRRVLIQTHDFPDPDAVASAFGLQTYLKQQNIKTDLVYCGEIQRDALKNMINKLGIEINSVKEFLVYKKDVIIIVDGCKWSKNVTDLPGFELAVIDHHIVKKPDDVPFIDIRNELGACSTIITSYFIKEGLDIPQNTATALKIGICRDTDLLTRKVTKEDMESYQYLFDYADNETVNSMLRNNIQLSDLAFFNKTISNLQTRGLVAWYFFEDGCETNLMGILGDFILSAQEINCSILFAKNKNSISISVRNENPKWNAAKLLRDLTQGVGAGGGHKEMAGGVIFNPQDFNLSKIIEKTLSKL